MRALIVVAAAAAVMSLSKPAFAEEASQTPYIDELKKTMPAEKEEARPDTSVEDPYIQEQRRKLEQKEGKSEEEKESYIDQLKKTDPEAAKQTPPGGKTYLEQEQERLNAAKKPGSHKDEDEGGGAIRAVQEGHSELQARKEGKIHHAMGFTFNATSRRTLTGSAEAVSRPFTDVYGDGFVPEGRLFYEFQPFHSEFWGNFGFVGSVSITYAEGKGTLSSDIAKPRGGGTFGTASRTDFHFLSFPSFVGIDYRFSALRLLQPYVQAGGLIIPYVESRSDAKSGYKGWSKGAAFGGGVNILLDWIAPGFSWDLYSSFNVKHYYLTIDFTRQQATSGDLQFTNNNLSLGFTYEF